MSFGDILMLKLNPRSVFAKIIANYDSTIPQSLIDNNSQIRNSISDNSWYIKTDGGYRANFEMSDGEAITNDRQMNTKEMLRMVGK